MKTLQVQDEIYAMLQKYAEESKIETSKALHIAIEEFLDPGITLKAIAEKLEEHDRRLSALEGKPILSLEPEKKGFN